MSKVKGIFHRRPTQILDRSEYTVENFNALVAVLKPSDFYWDSILNDLSHSYQEYIESKGIVAGSLIFIKQYKIALLPKALHSAGHLIAFINLESALDRDTYTPMWLSEQDLQNHEIEVYSEFNEELLNKILE